MNALIVGASRGIGKECAIKMANLGLNIIAVARDKTALNELKGEICEIFAKQKIDSMKMNAPHEISVKNKQNENSKNIESKSYLSFNKKLAKTPKFTPLALDLQKAKNLEKLLNFLEKNPPKIIIHSIGGKIPTDSQPLDIKSAQESLNLNFLIPAQINSFLLSKILQSPSAQDSINLDSINITQSPSLQIIHISSDSAQRGLGAPGYVSAKAALEAYAKSTARAFAPQKVLINVIAPGIVDFKKSAWDQKRQTNPTHYENTRKAQVLGRFGTPNEIALFVKNLVKNPNFLTNGAVFTLNGGN